MYIIEVGPKEGAASVALYELGNAAYKAWGAYVSAPSPAHEPLAMTCKLAYTVPAGRAWPAVRAKRKER